MVAKTLKKKSSAKPAKGGYATPVVDSAKDIWFAGLGAFAVVQQEGGKLIGQGTKLFDKLVSEGARFEKKSIGRAENTVDEIKTDVEKRFEGVRLQANESWESLGSVFDERVSGTLERLGIPTTKDFHRLSGSVQNISLKATNNWKDLEKVARDAAKNLGKLESEFTKRVKTALESLHVPGIEDLNKLADSVQKVSRDSKENLGKLEASTKTEFNKLNAGMQDVSRQVSSNLGKLEDLVEARVKVVLAGLGISSSDDINKLAAELKKLSKQVADFEKQLKDNARLAASKPAPEKALTPKAASSMTVTEKKKAAEAISKMKPVRKPEATS